MYKTTVPYVLRRESYAVGTAALTFALWTYFQEPKVSAALSILLAVLLVLLAAMVLTMTILALPNVMLGRNDLSAAPAGALLLAGYIAALYLPVLDYPESANQLWAIKLITSDLAVWFFNLLAAVGGVTLLLWTTLAVVGDNDRRYSDLSKELSRSGPTEDSESSTGSAYIRPEYRARPVDLNLSSMHGMEDLKVSVRESLQNWKASTGNGMLFFGPPGTGKTMVANAIAGELGLKIVKITYGDLASKWVGESTENLNSLFKAVREQSPVVFFIDEADSLLSARSSDNSEEFNRLVTTFLTKVDDLRRTCPGVLVIAATNFRDKMDSAAARIGRFDFPIEVRLPDEGARRHLIETGIKKGGAEISNETLNRTAVRFGGYNVPMILRVCSEAAASAKAAGRTHVNLNDLIVGQRKAQGYKGGAAEGAKSISELFYASQVKRMLEREAKSLRELSSFEENGGEMTKGLMLYGPPGTGKTAAAMAFAKECGWPILTYSGKDLMARDAIAKLKERANLMRPAIIFIDEADDILGNRDFSANKAETNELLQAMDGAGGTLYDIFWVIATNKPEAMDSAATRGGRFGKHIDLGLPDHEVMTELVAWWAAKNAVFVDSSPEWASDAAMLLLGMSQASALAALKDSKNIAAARAMENGQPTQITLDCVKEARSMMAG